MLIKLLVSRASHEQVLNRGDEIEVEDAEAIRMIEAEQAVPVRDAGGVETATASPRKRRAATAAPDEVKSPDGEA